MALVYGEQRGCGRTARLARVAIILVSLWIFPSPGFTSQQVEPTPADAKQTAEQPQRFADALLLFAASIGSIGQTRIQLGEGADINASGPNGETPLVRALRNSFFSDTLAAVDPLTLLWDAPYPGIEQLVQDRFQAIKETSRDAFPLAPQASSHSRYAALAEYLVEQGAALEARDRVGATALQYACAFGFDGAVRRMIARGVDVRGETGAMSPLMLAALFGHGEVARLLLDAGADINGRFGDGFSPLTLAAMGGYRDIVEMLLRRHAAFVVNGSTVLHDLMRFWQDHDITEGSARHAVVQRLLDAGLDAGAVDGDVATVLMAASRGRSPAVVRLLLARPGADGVVNKVDGHGWSALMYAAAGREKDEAAVIAGDLLRAGAKVDAAAPDGRTALLAAVGAGNESAARLLVAAGADLNVRAKDGLTPLMIAAHRGMKGMVRFLLDRQADADVTLPNGVAAIHLAAYSGAVEVLQLLVEAGAAVDQQTGSGFTPLLVAIRSCERERVDVVVRYLLQQGAETDIVIQGEKTPLWYARERGGLDSVVELLERHGSGLPLASLR